MLFTADFETTTIEPTKVWLWAVCEIGNIDHFQHGTNIDDFMDFCRYCENSTFYFHNLKWDISWIFIWLFEHGYQHVKDRKELEDNTFTTLISSKGQFYSCKVIFKKQGRYTNSVTFLDSHKILPFKIRDIAKGFGLPFLKGEIDYTLHNDGDREVTAEEIDYIKRDVIIPAMALHTVFSQRLTKITQGSNALFDYKRTVSEKKFEKWFPVPDYDGDVRQSYKGGYTYLNPKYKGVDIPEGVVFDVNSLYPWVMHDCPLPYGEGVYFQGEYQNDEIYPLFVQMFTCQFELKEGHLPTLQVKNSLFKFIPTEYLESSKDEDITLCMTSVDLKLFLDHYDIFNMDYHDGWKFKATVGLFTDYIDKWTEVKIQSKKDGNKAMYMLAKLMLNALYGKFALNPRVKSKYPYYDDGKIKYIDGHEEMRSPLYIPVGTFVTAYARNKTIRSCQEVYDRFIYADTDSMHLVGLDIPKGLQIDDTLLGYWSHESTFIRGRYLRQKTYIETELVDDKTYSKLEAEDQERCYQLNNQRVIDKITVAGLPDNCYKYVTWDNFHIGASYSGKLQQKSVIGGLILKNIDFSIQR